MIEYKFKETKEPETQDVDLSGMDDNESYTSVTTFPAEEAIKTPDMAEISSLMDIVEENEKNAREGGNKIVTSEDFVFTSEIIEKKKEKQRTMLLGASEKVVETIREGAEIIKRTSSDKERVRTYNKTAEMPKISHGKPAETGGKKTFLFFIIACLAVGILFGVQANSYYVAQIAVGKTVDAMSCAFGWFTTEGLPVVVDPLYPDVFFTAFAMGAGVLGVIGLFVWLDNDAKKASRVGHEHGSAHLGTPRDFKIFKNKFMER